MSSDRPDRREETVPVERVLRLRESTTAADGSIPAPMAGALGTDRYGALHDSGGVAATSRKYPRREKRHGFAKKRRHPLDLTWITDDDRRNGKISTHPKGSP
jgi:hypothetical protein